jgi:hypothetical protein
MKRKELIEEAKLFIDENPNYKGILSRHHAAVIMADFALKINSNAQFESRSVTDNEDKKEVCAHPTSSIWKYDDKNFCDKCNSWLEKAN